MPAVLDTSPSPGFLPWQPTWRACLTAAAAHGRESLAAEVAATAGVLAHFAGAEAAQRLAHPEVEARPNPLDSRQRSSSNRDGLTGGRHRVGGDGS